MSEDKKELSLINSSIEALSKSLSLTVSAGEFYSIMEAQCFGGKTPSRAEMAAFIVLAKQYNLNPLTKEIYAFPNRGGITPIIGIDGWLKIAHSNPNFNGITQELIMDDKNNVVAVKCIVARKDFAFHTEVVEFMAENNTRKGVWADRPIRMLKHRATAQAIRLAFNVNAMLDDEYNDMTIKEKYSAYAEEPGSDLVDKMEEAVKGGISSFNTAFNNLSKEDKQLLGGVKYAELRKKAEEADSEVIDV